MEKRLSSARERDVTGIFFFFIFGKVIFPDFCSISLPDGLFSSVVIVLEAFVAVRCCLFFFLLLLFFVTYSITFLFFSLFQDHMSPALISFRSPFISMGVDFVRAVKKIYIDKVYP